MYLKLAFITESFKINFRLIHRKYLFCTISRSCSIGDVHFQRFPQHDIGFAIQCEKSWVTGCFISMPKGTGRKMFLRTIVAGKNPHVFSRSKSDPVFERRVLVKNLRKLIYVFGIEHANRSHRWKFFRTWINCISSSYWRQLHKSIRQLSTTTVERVIIAFSNKTRTKCVVGWFRLALEYWLNFFDAKVIPPTVW